MTAPPRTGLVSVLIGPALLASALAVSAPLLGGGCGGQSGSSPPGTDGGGAADGGGLPQVFGGDRPVNIQIPRTYDPAEAYPLLVILHGYSANGLIQQAYLGFTGAADPRNTLIIAPDGTTDSSGNQFWNADDACCDIDHSGVDDVGYLSGLIEDIRAAYNVDPQRIYVIGHSNGGFMAYRMACERPDLVASAMVLAGAAAFVDPTTCVPSSPVSILHIHGDADAEVNYEGDSGLDAPYPGAVASVQRWAGYDGCADTFTAGAPLDLDSKLDGDETTTQSADGCPAGVAVELWTIHGGPHIPAFRQDQISDLVWTWLEDHPRP